jgi:hypothetical protein
MDRGGYVLPESHILIDEGISGTTMDRPALRNWCIPRRSPRWWCTTLIDSHETWGINSCWPRNSNGLASNCSSCRIRWSRARRGGSTFRCTEHLPSMSGRGSWSAFEAAQQALRNHQRWASRNRKHDYLLGGGALRCGRCGRVMSGMCRGAIRYHRCGSRHSMLDPGLRCGGAESLSGRH